MTRYFVDSAPVAIPEWDDDPAIISDRAPNVIYIKAKMDVATSAKVKSEMFTVGKDAQLEARLGANELALLIHNILRWEGPDLGSVPCTPERIRQLDPTEPHIAKVLEAIAERNKPPKSPKAEAGINNSMSNGDTGSTIPPQSVSLQLATGVPRSPLLRSLDGRRERSDD